MDITLPNIKQVNFYINPLMNNEEEIINYDYRLFKNFIDDGNNTHHQFTYYGDTRTKQSPKTRTDIPLNEYNGNETRQYTVNVNVTDNNDSPIEDASVTWERESSPIIPTDNFVVEVITFDDYRWLKGFPENDQEELYKIYQERQSYTDYLTFEVNNNNVKDITVSKDDVELYNKVLMYRSNEQNPVDYSSSQPYQTDRYNDVIIADSDKEHTIIHIILNDDDYTEPLFDFTQLLKEYPNIQEDYILANGETVPSIETKNTLVLKRQNNQYNAYKTVETLDGD